jgi:hypothetical protein
MLRKLLAEQITCLQIDVNDYSTEPVPETLSVVFALIISLCKRLNKLDFSQSYGRATFCTFDLSSTNFKSSTLTVLKIYVKSFDDCLYLLDGRFIFLSTLIIKIRTIQETSGTIDNAVSIIINCCTSRRRQSI